MITIETRSGKRAYETVAERVKKFRSVYPVDSGWQLLTEVEFPKDGIVLCRAKIVDPNGRLVATGTAEEIRGSNFINKTSAVENAETSAIGRALFAAGFGGGEFCSAEELLGALKRQEELMVAENEAQRTGEPASPGVGAVEDRPSPAATPPDQMTEMGDVFDIPSESEEKRVVPPVVLGFPEDCGIQFVREGNMLVARDHKKGATFANRTSLKKQGFTFDGSQRVWVKKMAEAA